MPADYVGRHLAATRLLAEKWIPTKCPGCGLYLVWVRTVDIPKKGDKYVYRVGEHPPVFILVKRVSIEHMWADIACCTWAVMWTKRMTIPFPVVNFRQSDWTMDNVNEWIPK